MPELISIRELLKDPTYREFFTKVPVLPNHYDEASMPWRLMVQKTGETVWRAKKFGTYKEAFAGFKKMLPIISNAAINCPALDFNPPMKNYRVKNKFITVRGGHKKPYLVTKVWTPQLEPGMDPHTWCPHCRRPSIFDTIGARPIRKGTFLLTPAPELIRRCIICGASERIVDLRRPYNHQKWDQNRLQVHNVA